MVARYRLDAEHGRFTVQVFAGGMLSFLGHSPTFAVRDFIGAARFDPDTTEGAGIELRVRADSLGVLDRVSPTDREEIEGRMRREVLETATYPEIRFEADALSARPAGNHQYAVHIDGRLTLHGVTAPHPVDAQLALYTDGLRLTGETELRPSDYHIRPVTALGGTIRLENRLHVVFDLVGWKEDLGQERP